MTYRPVSSFSLKYLSYAQNQLPNPESAFPQNDRKKGITELEDLRRTSVEIAKWKHGSNTTLQATRKPPLPSDHSLFGSLSARTTFYLEHLPIISFHRSQLYNMSRLITHTNILVDDFDFAKSFPVDSFIHVLTHFHADHYEGLSPLWNYGPIHCTHQSKIYLQDKFPKLKRVEGHSYNEPFPLTLPGDHLLHLTFLDACHIPGSAMVLIKGFMGTILFTGDFRYEFSMVRDNPTLFPPNLRRHLNKIEDVEKMEGISIAIDEMVFDNTYCHPMFDFETEQPITHKIIRIIERNRHRKLIYIAIGALGKHQILQKISQYFQTTIVVTEQQMHRISLSGINTEFLTTNSSEGFIRLISKKQRAAIVEQTKKGPLAEEFICIDTDFLMLDHQSPDEINYIVPYSLHSNFKEMEKLIRMIKPCILRKIVIPYADFRQVKLRMKIDHRLKFAKYLDFLEKKVNHSEAGYSKLVRDYTEIHRLSRQYLHWFRPKEQQRLMHDYGLGDGEQDHNLRKRKPVLLEEEELNYSSKGKPSLRELANGFNAVHRNTTLERSFSNQLSRSTGRHYDKLFEESSKWESRTRVDEQDD